MDYLPLNLSLKDKYCLVVGGGNIALRKSKQLLNAGANLFVVAIDFHSEFLNLSKLGDLNLIRDEYKVSYLENKLLVIAATDDLEVNRKVFEDAECKGILVNVPSILLV